MVDTSWLRSLAAMRRSNLPTLANPACYGGIVDDVFRFNCAGTATWIDSRHLRVCGETDPAFGVTAEARQVVSAHIWVTVKILLQKSD
jgi:hypothetical protein